MNKWRSIYVELFRDRQVRTDGTSAQTPRYEELDVDLGNLLLHAEDVTLISNTRVRTNNFGWNIALYSGWDRGSELGPFWLVGTTGTTWITATTAVRHPPYGALANFLLNSRVSLVTANSSAVSTIESATISAGLLIRTWGA
jgi:hypothetical protein